MHVARCSCMCMCVCLQGKLRRLPQCHSLDTVHHCLSMAWNLLRDPLVSAPPALESQVYATYCPWPCYMGSGDPMLGLVFAHEALNCQSCLLSQIHFLMVLVTRRVSTCLSGYILIIEHYCVFVSVCVRATAFPGGGGSEDNFQGLVQDQPGLSQNKPVKASAHVSYMPVA